MSDLSISGVPGAMPMAPAQDVNNPPSVHNPLGEVAQPTDTHEGVRASTELYDAEAIKDAISKPAPTTPEGKIEAVLDEMVILRRSNAALWAYIFHMHAGLVVMFGNGLEISPPDQNDAGAH